MSKPVFTLNELNGQWRWICGQCRGHSHNFPTGQQAQDDFYARHAHVHCQRPECGGEVHTDGWGTPIRCPREGAADVACAVLHTDAEGNVIPCPDRQQKQAPSGTSSEDRLRAAEIRAAIAEHEAEAYRNQVQALVRELLRAREVPEEDLPQKVRVIILDEEAL